MLSSPRSMKIDEATPGRSTRIPYVRPCRLWRETGWTDAVLCGLSGDDVYVTFLNALDRTIPKSDEKVRISFLLPEDPIPVEGGGVVTSRSVGRTEIDGLPAGCAVAFDSLQESDRRRILDLVGDYRRARQPRIEVPRPHTGFTRMPYVEPCLLVGASATWNGVLCNLSVLGTYVTMDPAPKVGEEVRLFFGTPGSADPLELRGEVVWVNSDDSRLAHGLPPGCGVRFIGDEGRGQVELMILEYESLRRQ